MLGDEAGGDIVSGEKKSVGLGGPNGRELGAEILGVAAVFLRGDDFAAEGREGLGEDVGEADRVGGRRIDQERGAAETEVFPRVGGEHGALKGIGETDAEDAVADGGHFGIGGGRRDERDAGGLGDGCGFQGAGRRAFADEGDHFVAGDEFLGGGGRLTGEGAVVFNDEFDGATENAAGGVEIIDSEAGTAEGRFAERGVAAGDRHEETEFDGLAGRCGGAGECGERENDDEEAEAREHGASRRKISDGRKLAKGYFLLRAAR